MISDFPEEGLPATGGLTAAAAATVPGSGLTPGSGLRECERVEWERVDCHARVEQSKQSVLPVPVGLSSNAFSEF